MTVLVTGGAGFIGANYTFYHLRQHPEDRVICLDELTYAGNPATLDPIRGDARFRFVKASICDREAVDRLFAEERPEVVINFAAESHVDRSIDAPDVFLRTNVLGVGVLMDACRAWGGVRFHQVGTDEVYGDLPLDRPELFFSETTPIHASSPYSASKAGADLLCLAYHRTYGLPVTISRCSNNYGPYQFPEKLIPLMINNCLAEKSLPVYGDGMQIRDWLYVEDHCAAICAVLEKGVLGEVYNIGGNNERANIEIVRLILENTGKSEDLIVHVKDRPGHDRRYAIDNAKITGTLGWSPKYTFQTGMAQTIEWYLHHREWMDKIVSGEYLKYYENMYANR